MGRVNDILAAAAAMANDNSHVYRKYPNNMGPNTWDCCTYLSKVLYDAGIAPGNWHDNGYFWPHISESGFDYFLTNTCGMTKLDYTGKVNLIPGDILIARETYGHTVMFAENGGMWEGNPNYPDDKSIGLHDWAEMDWCYVYRLPGEYDSPTKEEYPDRKLNYAEWKLQTIWKWTDTVKFGDKNDYVKFIQQYLTAWGHYKGTIDGSFGTYTLEAVKDWQRVNNLTQTGIVSVNEWNIILNDNQYKEN